LQFVPGKFRHGKALQTRSTTPICIGFRRVSAINDEIIPDDGIDIIEAARIKVSLKKSGELSGQRFCDRTKAGGDARTKVPRRS